MLIPNTAKAASSTITRPQETFYISKGCLNHKKTFSISIFKPGTVIDASGTVKRSISISNKKLGKVSVDKYNRIFFTPAKTSGGAVITYTWTKYSGTYIYRIPIKVCQYKDKYVNAKSCVTTNNKMEISQIAPAVKNGKYCNYNKTKKGFSLKYNKKKKGKYKDWIGYNNGIAGAGQTHFGYYIYINYPNGYVK